MSADERQAALDSGMVAVGENVVAVVTYTAAATEDGGILLEGNITARGLSPRLLAIALRGTADELERDRAEPCGGCGEVHD